MFLDGFIIHFLHSLLSLTIHLFSVLSLTYLLAGADQSPAGGRQARRRRHRAGALTPTKTKTFHTYPTRFFALNTNMRSKIRETLPINRIGRKKR
jgi:hypothetical protein